MNQDSIVQGYVNGNIRPTTSERDYVKKKYAELKDVLSDGTGNVFRSGSFARHTATTPIHDLDVIWVDESYASIDEPEAVLDDLSKFIQKRYKELHYQTPKISIQSHSVTLVFNDGDEEFAIDIVPAIKADDGALNEYDQPIFMVPEIIRYNHHNRSEFYEKQAREHNAVRWLLTDPKGYIRESVLLDDATDENYRTVVRIVKAWRTKMKRLHGDSWKLKSFHSEQICVRIFEADKTLSCSQALKQFYEQLPTYIMNAPMIEDRAYSSDNEDKYIDEYMADPTRVTSSMKSTIINEARAAMQHIQLLDTASSAEMIETALRQLTQKAITKPVSTTQTYTAAPRPYCEY